jgi:hypothetical protein
MVSVCVFTDGNAVALNNQGVGYKDKFINRIKTHGDEAALYKEAMAILALKEERPDFKIYVVDGIDHTPEQLAFNLMNDAPSFGPVEKWCSFMKHEWCKYNTTLALNPPAGTTPTITFASLVAFYELHNPQNVPHVATTLRLFSTQQILAAAHGARKGMMLRL